MTNILLQKLLKEKVKETKKTVEQIANESGITRQQFYLYIDKMQVPGVHIANSIARYFGVPTEKLFPYYAKPRNERYEIKKSKNNNNI